MIWRLIAIALFGIASIAGPVAATGSALSGNGVALVVFLTPEI